MHPLSHLSRPLVRPKETKCLSRMDYLFQPHLTVQWHYYGLLLWYDKMQLKGGADCNKAEEITSPCKSNP